MEAELLGGAQGGPCSSLDNITTCPVMRVLWVPAKEAGSSRLCPPLRVSWGLGARDKCCLSLCSWLSVSMWRGHPCVPALLLAACAALMVRAWLLGLALLRALPICPVIQALGETRRSCPVFCAESKGSLGFVSLHLRAFLVASSAHCGSVSLHASTSPRCLSLPLTVPSAQLGAAQPRASTHPGVQGPLPSHWGRRHPAGRCASR